MAMVITDNSPSPGYVAWTGVVMTFKDINYSVTNGNSNKKFIWWDFTNPNAMQESDTLPTLTDDDCVFLLNISGTHYLIPGRTIYHSELFYTDPHPAGFIHDWGGTIAAIPTGWLHCNGASLLRADYLNLFTAIGVIHGSADGTHFNIPDLRDVSIVGAKQDDTGIPKTNISGALTQSGGAATHTLTEAQMPAHTHTTNAAPGGTDDMDTFLGNDQHIHTRWTAITSSSTGGGGAHNNLHPYYVMTYIIKT